MLEDDLNRLGSGPLYKFSDWPNPSLPREPGVYTSGTPDSSSTSAWRARARARDRFAVPGGKGSAVLRPRWGRLLLHCVIGWQASKTPDTTQNPPTTIGSVEPVIWQGT
jgi:hypothetical protein